MAQLQCKKKMGNEGGFLFCLILFFILLALNVALQLANDSYGADFGAHPDEAAHVVTSLMVRDYMVGGFIEELNPVDYAKRYYDFFPKVAIGHYPPLFYILGGAWLVFSASADWCLVFSAILTSGCGLITFLIGRISLGKISALMATLIFTVLPLSQQYTYTFMSDMLLLAFCLLAAWSFAGFMGSGRLRDSLLFGLLASAAMLTKLSGFWLAFLPLVSLLLARKMHLFRTKSIWLAPLVVSVLALPWIVFTYSITSEGVTSSGDGLYLTQSWSFFSRAIIKEIGLIVIVLASARVLILLWAFLCNRRDLGDMELVNVSICVIVFLFYLFVPAGLEQRYLLVLMPSALLLAFKALENFLSLIVSLLSFPKHHEYKWLNAAIFLCGALLLVGSFELRPKFAHGFGKLIEVLEKEKADNRQGVMVVSDSRGEGAIIAASALASSERPLGGIRIYRGSKRLSSSDWLGRNYQSFFTTVPLLREYMHNGGFHFLAIDNGVPESKKQEYHVLVGRLVDEHPEDFKFVRKFETFRKGGKEAGIILYRIREHNQRS